MLVPNPLASPRRRRRAAALSLAAGATVLLSGCYGITDQQASQLDVVGDAHVVTSLCITSGEPSITGSRTGESTTQIAGVQIAAPIGSDSCVASDATFTYPQQLFLGYQVPDGTEAPATLDAAGSLEGATYSRSDAYAAALAEQQPPRAGTHWVGYATAELPQQLAYTEEQHATVEGDFGVDGLASGAPLTLRTVSGWRWVRPAEQTPPVEPAAASGPTEAWTVDRPIVCGQAQSSPTPSDQTTCIESAFPEGPAENAPPTPTPDPTTFSDGAPQALEVIDPSYVPIWPVQTLNLNALEISAPKADAAVVAGSVASVSFPVASKLASPDAPASLPISAASTVPGGVLIAPTTYALGTDAPLGIDVAVPASTPPGDYQVSVDLGKDSGARFAQAKLKVAAPAAVPAPAPGATPTPAPLTIPQKLAKSAADLAAVLTSPEAGKALRKGSATMPVGMPVRGFVRVSLLGKKPKGKKAPVLAVGTAETDHEGVKNVVLKRTTQGKKILGTRKTVSGTLVIRFWGREGKTISVPVTLTLG